MLCKSDKPSIIIIIITRHAVQNRISNMGGLSPELKLRLGDLLIRPVASFGCQIWGVNFLDLGKGVDGNELEGIHLSYLRPVLGVGIDIAGNILRAESSSISRSLD